MSFVNVQEISAGYHRTNVIEKISFEIERGELVGILGANGSGKSTLVKAICNILPHEGDVSIDGQSIKKMNPKEAANRISYVPQKSGISMDMSVLEVVLMGFNPKLGLLENPGKKMVQKAMSAIENVGLADKTHANYMHLSEGQKQMVLLARSLVSDGRLLVMDEPESALDFGVRYKMLHLMKEWIKEGDRAGLVTLHDVNLALNNCDKLILINNQNIAGIIHPKDDIIDMTEGKLASIYGDISLLKTTDKTGRENYVMIHNSEDV